jgi:putative heme iron utilization protein
LSEPQVSLMIAEPDTGQQDPQTLARVSLQGVASLLPLTDAEYEAVRAAYLQRFPTVAMTVSLGDFAFYRIVPQRGRFVAGFGQILQPDEGEPTGSSPRLTALVLGR